MLAAPLGAVLYALLASGCAVFERPQREAPLVAAAPRSAPSAPSAPSIPGVAPWAADRPLARAPKPAETTPSLRVLVVESSDVPAPAPASAPAPATPAAPPPLDLKSLETRLRETDAIGLFTKLTVKNQVDELLERFRDYYKGRLQVSLAELRQAYDLLVMKVMALLQDADPPLASDLAASRESIWGILSDREQFSTL
jgi:hypothetical protein